jgi:hypothetical protein
VLAIGPPGPYRQDHRFKHWPGLSCKTLADALRPFDERFSPKEIARHVQLAEKFRFEKGPISRAGIGKLIGLTEAARQQSCAWNLRSIDHDEAALAARRRKADKQRKAAERRAAGRQLRARYVATSLSRLKPWEAERVSRRTWERQRKIALELTQVCPNHAPPIFLCDASVSAARVLSTPVSVAASTIPALHECPKGPADNGTDVFVEVHLQRLATITFPKPVRRRVKEGRKGDMPEDTKGRASLGELPCFS